MKERHVDGGRAEREGGGDGRFWETVRGEKGRVVLGVEREFRCVEIVSSRDERERRRKSRRARSLKQNCGV